MRPTGGAKGSNAPRTVTLIRVRALFSTARTIASRTQHDESFGCAKKKACRRHIDLHQSIARYRLRTTQRTSQTTPSTPATARSLASASRNTNCATPSRSGFWLFNRTHPGSRDAACYSISHKRAEQSGFIVEVESSRLKLSLCFLFTGR